MIAGNTSLGTAGGFAPRSGGAISSPMRSGRARRRMSADPVDLPGKDAFFAFVKTELDGGRTGIDHADQRLLG